MEIVYDCALPLQDNLITCAINSLIQVKLLVVDTKYKDNFYTYMW